jgi:hypothetical protein
MDPGGPLPCLVQVGDRLLEVERWTLEVERWTLDEDS